LIHVGSSVHIGSSVPDTMGSQADLEFLVIRTLFCCESY